MPERLYVRDYMVVGVAQVRMTDTVRDAVREMPGPAYMDWPLWALTVSWSEC